MKKVISFLIFSIPLFAYCQCNISGESDTTIIASNSWYGVKSTTRYYFKKKDYSNAQRYIQLANLPYMGLNQQAKSDMNNLSKYILHQEDVKIKTHK